MFERGTTTITVKFSHREDGGLRVESQDVPGLFLSNRDPRVVLRDLIPAIKLLIRENEGVEVEVLAPVEPALSCMYDPTFKAPDALELIAATEMGELPARHAAG